jgi:hypothetical protein
MTSAPAAPLVVRFTRLSNTHHRLDVLRADGTRESREFETRSCLFHDLVHFAVETEAGLANSFYGRLARGVAYADLAHVDDRAGTADELVLTERVVGPLQGACRAGIEPRAFVVALMDHLVGLGEPPPSWLSAELVARRRARAPARRPVARDEVRRADGAAVRGRFVAAARVATPVFLDLVSIAAAAVRHAGEVAVRTARSGRRRRLGPVQEDTMRYVCMHKVSPSSESGRMPSPELVTGMGQLIGDTAKAGKFLAGGGLKPSRDRVRLTFANGVCTVHPGPVVGGNELPAGLAIIKVRTFEEGIEWAKRFGLAAAAEEVQLGLMTEPWDLGICPKPEGAPLQLMILPKATKATEAGAKPSPKVAAEVAALTAEMVRAGVLTFVETLRPSREAVRLHYRSGKRTVTDGPFTESKELIGGFCMVEMSSLDEVLEWCNRFAKIIAEDFELDVRLAGEAGDAAAAGRR